MEVKPRALLREKGTSYAGLRLGDEHWSNEELTIRCSLIPF